MGFWIFLTFHIISLLFCIIATRMTFYVVMKHQVNPKIRFLLFGFIKTRYVAFLYILSMIMLTTFSISYALYHFSP